jgi:hypothetical protein
VLNRARDVLMSQSVLLVVSAVLVVEIVVLLLGGTIDGRWERAGWMLFLCASGVAASQLNASPSAPLLGRIILVLTAVLMMGFSIAQIGLWLAGG